MKIVVIGGTGLIGSRTVTRLRERGHEVVAASPSSGVDTLTGNGLTEALQGAQVLIDLSNPPTVDGKAARAFFETSGKNIAAASAGLRHHVVLSIVGTERLQGSGYFQGKLAQEEIARNTGIPFTIVRATQFFEFIGVIILAGNHGTSIELSPALMQPIAADDVADAVADAALAEPARGIVEIAGPERAPISDFGTRFLRASGDRRPVVADWATGYFGSEIDDHTLVPSGTPRLGATRFNAWLRERAAQPA